MTLTSESEALLAAIAADCPPHDEWVYCSHGAAYHLDKWAAAVATAERERIAAALPEALATALLAIPDEVRMFPWDSAGAILAHPAVRALLQPEGEP